MPLYCYCHSESFQKVLSTHKSTILTTHTLRDDLIVTTYSTSTQDEKYYAEVRARDGSYEIASFCVSRAMKAAAESHGMDI